MECGAAAETPHAQSRTECRTNGMPLRGAQGGVEGWKFSFSMCGSKPLIDVSLRVGLSNRKLTKEARKVFVVGG